MNSIKTRYGDIQKEIITISQFIKIQDSLNTIFNRLWEYLNYESAEIILQNNGNMKILGLSGDHKNEYLNQQNDAIGNSKALQKIMFKSVSPLYLERSKNSNKFGIYSIPDHVQSWIGAPLIYQEKVYGFISFQIQKNLKLNEDMASMTQILVNIASKEIINSKINQLSNSQLTHLLTIYQVNTLLTTNADIKTTMEKYLELVVRGLDVDASAVLIFDKASQTLDIAKAIGFSTDNVNFIRLHPNVHYVGKQAIEEKTICRHDLEIDNSNFYRSKDFLCEGFKTYYGVPIISNDEVLGVLEIFSRTDLLVDCEWENLLVNLSEQAGMAIENIKLIEEIQKKNKELRLQNRANLLGYTKPEDIRDWECESPAQNVVEMTVQLARALGLSPEEIVHVYRGALLHDFGALVVSDIIKLKPGKLNDEEWEIMRKHPEFAYKSFADIPILNPSLDIPYCHHEKWDGSGYPRGLKKEEIPIAARIFAIIDVYDALSSERPYRDAWPKEKIYEYIQEQAGKHFDPTIVEIFTNIFPI